MGPGHGCVGRREGGARGNQADTEGRRAGFGAQMKSSGGRASKLCRWRVWGEKPRTVSILHRQEGHSDDTVLTDAFTGKQPSRQAVERGHSLRPEVSLCLSFPICPRRV